MCQKPDHQLGVPTTNCYSLMDEKGKKKTIARELNSLEKIKCLHFSSPVLFFRTFVIRSGGSCCLIVTLKLRSLANLP